MTQKEKREKHIVYILDVYKISDTQFIFWLLFFVVCFLLKQTRFGNLIEVSFYLKKKGKIPVLTYCSYDIPIFYGKRHAICMNPSSFFAPL